RRAYQVAAVALDEREPYGSIKRLVDNHVQMMHSRLTQSFGQLRRVERPEMMRFKPLDGKASKRCNHMLAHILLVAFPGTWSNLRPHDIEPACEILLDGFALGDDQ